MQYSQVRSMPESIPFAGAASNNVRFRFPHRGQMEVLRSPERFNVLMCGRRLASARALWG